jgi:putative redox protein
MKISAGDGDHTVLMDYPMGSEPAGGLTPLKLLLASLAGCSGNALALLLRKSRQPFQRLEVQARGLRREEHPTLFTEIFLDFTVVGRGLDRMEVEKALKRSEELICPVWAMLKAGTPIHPSLKMIEE